MMFNDTKFLVSEVTSFFVYFFAGKKVDVWNIEQKTDLKVLLKNDQILEQLTNKEQNEGVQVG